MKSKQNNSNPELKIALLSGKKIIARGSLDRVARDVLMLISIIKRITASAQVVAV